MFGSVRSKRGAAGAVAGAGRADPGPLPRGLAVAEPRVPEGASRGAVITLVATTAVVGC
jgi:hypothetical protein